jgi:hypothetical protein
MEKVVFEKNFNDCLDKNFEKYSKFFDFQSNIFFELETSIFEVNKCQILELHKASITLTNYILERLLKIALIYNETGVESKPVEEWDSIFEAPNDKYGSKPLSNTIELCNKQCLITNEERDVLFDIIRVSMRNGFSHADSSKILASLPDKTTMYLVSLSNPSDLKEVQLDPKIMPAIQAVHIDNVAKEISEQYFSYVFDLIGKIEGRLIEQHNKTFIKKH